MTTVSLVHVPRVNDWYFYPLLEVSSLTLWAQGKSRAYQAMDHRSQVANLAWLIMLRYVLERLKSYLELVLPLKTTTID